MMASYFSLILRTYTSVAMEHMDDEEFFGFPQVRWLDLHLNELQLLMELDGE